MSSVEVDFEDSDPRRAQPDYFVEALSVLKEKAASRDLIVDADATQALRTELGSAIAAAEQSEGQQIYSGAHEAQFVKTANQLADLAIVAASGDHSQFVNHSHIESAVQQLRIWDSWPWTEE